MSFSSITFHVRLNINYCEIENSYKIYSYKTYKIFDSVIFGDRAGGGCHIRECIVLLRYG